MFSKKLEFMGLKPAISLPQDRQAKYRTAVFFFSLASSFPDVFIRKVPVE
jgi:hypothetical protein